MISLRPFSFADRLGASKKVSHPLWEDPEVLAAYLTRNPGLSLCAETDRLPVGYLLGGHDGWRGRVLVLWGENPPIEAQLFLEFQKRLGRVGIRETEHNGSLHGINELYVASRGAGCDQCPLPELIRKPRTL